MWRRRWPTSSSTATASCSGCCLDRVDSGGEIMSDIDELTRLNRDYVASVQNSNVKRFDEILADEFYCSNPDKSLVDRAGFLKQTAAPVTITKRDAHAVRIRRMADFAITHTSTS